METDNYFERSLKVIAKGSFLVFAGLALSEALGLVRRIIIVRSLSAVDYGLFALGMSVINFAIIISNLGMEQSSQRFIAYYRGEKDYSSVKGTIISTSVISGVLAIVIMVLLMLTSGVISSFFKKPGLAQVLLLLALLVPLYRAIMQVSSVYQGFENTFPMAFFGGVELSFAQTLLVALFALLKGGLNGVVLAVILGHAFTVLLLLPYIRSHMPHETDGLRPSFNLKRLLFFGLPISVQSLTQSAITYTDTIILGYFVVASQVGLYNVATPIYMSLSIFLFAVGYIYVPVASRMIGEGKQSKLRSLYRSVTKWQFMFTLPALLLCFFFPSELITLLFGARYTKASFVLQLLLVGELFNTILGPNGNTLVAYGRATLAMVYWVSSALVNVCGNLILIPRFGITGAAIATAASLCFLNFLCSVSIFINYRIHPFTLNYVKPVLSSAFVAFCLYYPMKLGLNVSKFFFLPYYLLLVGVVVLMVIITHSIEPVDVALYRAIRMRLGSEMKRFMLK
ncbi:MAG: flippase [Actinomycetota bacterium]|nr:flippase [Actinomycetota bacterium]